MKLARVLPLVVVAALAAAALASADKTDPKVRTTKADQGNANASVLSFTDLGPAWSGGPEKVTSLKIPVCPANQPNNSDLTVSGQAESGLELASEGIRVDTTALVLRSQKQVATLFNRMLRPATIDTCLRYNLEKSVGGAGVSVGLASALKLDRVGSHGALYRVSIAVTSGSKKVLVYSDFLFVAQNRTEFFVNVVAPSNLGAQLLALENRVAKILVTNAKP